MARAPGLSPQTGSTLTWPFTSPLPQALEHSGGVDFLVCNAAVNPLVGSVMGTSEQVWDKVRGCWELVGG